jgi:hypothetical protein
MRVPFSSDDVDDPGSPAPDSAGDSVAMAAFCVGAFISANSPVGFV